MIQIDTAVKSIGTVQYSVPPCDLCPVSYSVVNNLLFQNECTDHIPDCKRQVLRVSPTDNVMDLPL